MNPPKVSIIIPVYNTEAYVSEAIGSIRQQTLTDLEIIAVNDGSTDKSLALLESIATEEPRLKVISQPNCGVSVARNTGLKVAEGEYIYFLDSDDLLENDALEICYHKCHSEQLDFVFFDALNLNPGNKYSGQNYIHTTRPTEKVWKGTDVLGHLLDTHTFRTPVWLNFISKNYLRQNHLSFYPDIIHEDELFSFELYLYASRVGYIAQTFTQRRLRENSIMTARFSYENIKGYFAVAGEIFRIRKNLSEDRQKLADKHLSAMLNAVVRKAHQLPAAQKWRIFWHCLTHHYLSYLHIKNVAVLFIKSK